jgi:hypothetical protein
MSKKIQYQICVQGQLDKRWTEWFEGMKIKSEGGYTTLSGPLSDQAALHGILSRIRDLGLPLISAQQSVLEEEEYQQSTQGARDK